MSTEPDLQPITEDDIANYLIHTPAFFDRYAQLLSQVQLVHPHSGRAVSLQERQAQMLREKIRALEQRLMQMVRFGNENAVIAERLERWACDLLQSPDAELPVQMAQAAMRIFLVPQAAIRVWDVDAAYADCTWTQGVDASVKEWAQTLEEPYCGANDKPAAVQWLDEPGAAASLALLPLRPVDGGSVQGILVLASPDMQRFHEGMATDYLGQMARMASAALARLCTTAQAPTQAS